MAVALGATLINSPGRDFPGAKIQSAAVRAGGTPITCSVLEVFQDGKLGVRVILFHQRDKADGPRLGALLAAQSGRELEIAVPGGQRYRATVFRMRSCFGRGMVLVRAGELNLCAHDQFTLHPPADP